MVYTCTAPITIQPPTMVHTSVRDEGERYAVLSSLYHQTFPSFHTRTHIRSTYNKWRKYLVHLLEDMQMIDSSTTL